MLALLSLVACHEPGCGAPCERVVDTDDTELPPYVHEEPVAEWTADEVGATIAETFGAGFPNGTLLRDTYLEMMAQGDIGECPVFTGEYSGPYPDDLTEQNILGCTAGSGYSFSGVCQYDAEEFSDGGGTSLIWALGGDFELAYPDGARFGAGGGVTWQGYRSTGGGDSSFESTIRGTWFDESNDVWLGQGFSGLFSVSGGAVADVPFLDVHGGIAVGDVDMFFDEVSWDWATCDGLPHGQVRLRDTRGYWYVWTLEDDCDACGDVVFHGDTNLGELCLDLSAVGEDAYHSMAVP
jgi:hypothetical protein